MTLLRKKILGEDFHVTIKPIYNREDTLAFTFSPDQKKVEIGEEIKITVKLSILQKSMMLSVMN